MILESPNRIITRINGVYEVPLPLVPDIRWVHTITETLTEQNGQVQCSTERHTDLSGGVLAIPAARVLAEAAAQTLAPNMGGIGCALVNFFPRSLIGPGGGNQNLIYTRVSVDPGGVSVGGLFPIPLNFLRVLGQRIPL